jgi:hypothetical protein
MPPRARAIINEIASTRGIDPKLIMGRCRKKKVFRARVEVAERLAAIGYSTPRIGRILNHDHSTIVFYLGRGKKKPSTPVWRAPKVRTLLVIKPEAPPKPRKRYLKPYAGADWREYQWKEIRA